MPGSQSRSSSILGRAVALPLHTRGGSRMRESRSYGSVRGARGETRVPTATHLLALDRDSTVQALAVEAFNALLRKHRRRGVVETPGAPRSGAPKGSRRPPVG